MPDIVVLEDGLPGERRRLHLRIGDIDVDVTEVPGRTLSEREWSDVSLARRSYTAMWGEDPSMLAGDPQDGRDGAVYDTWHYLAWVRDGVDGGAARPDCDPAVPGKLVTMRKVRLAGARLTAGHRADPFDLLPGDIQFWRARTPGGAGSLWEALKAYARRLAPGDELAEYRISAIGRIGSFPYGGLLRSERQRERTAIAFAAIGLLAAHEDQSLLWVLTLCPELRDRVLGVAHRGGYVAPSFPTTAQVLGLTAAAVRMDNDLAVVQVHKTKWPGYFIHNEDAAEVLAGLLERQQVTTADLGATFADLLIKEPTASGLAHLEQMARMLKARDHRGLARLLTQPRLFKYLAPLIAGDEPLSRMSSAQFRARLLRDTRDGPFSAAVQPRQWTANARAVLRAASEKYGTGGLPVPSFKQCRGEAPLARPAQVARR